MKSFVKRHTIGSLPFEGTWTCHADFHCCMAERKVWFGIIMECWNLSFVTGDTLCFSCHALIALCSYVKPSAAMYGSSITSCITHKMKHIEHIVHEMLTDIEKQIYIYIYIYDCLLESDFSPEELDRKSGLVHIYCLFPILRKHLQHPWVSWELAELHCQDLVYLCI